MGRPKKVVKLDAVQYWQWRNMITEKWLAEAKAKNAELELINMSLQADILKARMSLFQSVTVAAKNQAVVDAGTRYNTLKQEIETTLGVSLNGKVIDDVTFEVKDLQQGE